MTAEFTRVCGSCAQTIHHPTARALYSAKRRNLPCRSCSSKKDDINILTRRCPTCNEIITYKDVKIRRAADKKNLSCQSCAGKVRWTPEAIVAESERMKLARQDANGIWNTVEYKQNKSEGLKRAHQNPDSVWNQSWWRENQSQKMGDHAASGSHPFQTMKLDEETLRENELKRVVTRKDPNSEWQRHVMFVNSDKGRREASERMKISRATNPVFHSDEFKAKNNQHLIKARKQVRKKQISQHERELAESLRKLDPQFNLNEFVFNVGPYHPDIVNHETKTIIEFHGDYAHSNPSIHASNNWNSLRHKNASDVWLSDAKRNAFIESQGWHVIVVWESDWKRSRSEVVERIISASNARKSST